MILERNHIIFILHLIKTFMAGFKFLIYSIYIQKLQVSWIFGGNSVFKFLVYSIYIQYIFNFQVTRILATYSLQIQFLTVPTGIRAVTSTWRTMTNELRRRRGVPTSRMES